MVSFIILHGMINLLDLLLGYGEDVTPDEKKHFKELIHGNAIN